MSAVYASHQEVPVRLRSASSASRSAFMRCSHGVVADLTGPDSHDAVEVDRPHLAVADLAGSSVGADEVEDLVEVGRLHHDLELDLGDEVDRVLGPAERFALAALA